MGEDIKKVVIRMKNTFSILRTYNEIIYTYGLVKGSQTKTNQWLSKRKPNQRAI